jgi:DNA polymerase-1
VLVAIEDNGVVLDKDYLAGFARELTDLLSSQQKEIYKMAGEEYNISSPKQLSEVLFGKMKIPGGKKNKSGGFSTNEKILLNYLDDYPIIEKILSYREIFKLKSTYTQTLIDQVNPKTGRIHTTFNQAIAATGRLSSTNPNLQNIPTSTDFGQQIRKAFIAPKDKLLLSFDYSQQELRLLAHLSGEKKLTAAFTKDVDIHALTASQIFKIPVKDVNSQQRRVGKTVNFGVVYGISAFGLSDRLKISNQDGQKFIDSFYNSYPKVREYFDNLKQKARVNGYVETIFGRRRDASLLTAANYQLRMATEREIINFPLQGSAADIMKLVMIRAQKLIATNYAEFAMMVLQVHDELIFEVNTLDLNDKNFKKLAREIKEIMLNTIKLEVPVNVGIEVGKNWAEMKEID